MHHHLTALDEFRTSPSNWKIRDRASEADFNSWRTTSMSSFMGVNGSREYASAVGNLAACYLPVGHRLG